MKKVYLAGPDVFYVDALSRFGEMKRMCSERGLQGLSPFDNEFKISDHPGLEDALTIFRLNRRMIEECDAVVANLTPFRGVSADPGTVWEMGYAMGNDKPVAAFSTDPMRYKERVLGWAMKRPGMLQRDANGLVLVDGMVVEPFGLRDNLMLEGSLMQQRSVPGGIVLLDSFEMALDSIAARLA